MTLQSQGICPPSLLMLQGTTLQSQGIAPPSLLTSQGRPLTAQRLDLLLELAQPRVDERLQDRREVLLARRLRQYKRVLEYLSRYVIR